MVARTLERASAAPAGKSSRPEPLPRTRGYLGRLWLDAGCHRSLGAGQEAVSPKGVDLVSLEFGMFKRGREHGHAALGVDIFRHPDAGLDRVAEERAEHDHHVLIGVIVVVPEHHVIPRLPLGAAGRLHVLGWGGLDNGGLFDTGTGGGSHFSGTLAIPGRGLMAAPRPGNTTHCTAPGATFHRCRQSDPGASAVLDRRFVADNIDLVAANSRLRGASADVARFAELDRLRRQFQADIDRLNQEAGQVSRSIGKAADEAERDARKAEGRRLREEITAIEAKSAEVTTEADLILKAIPNLTHPSAPVGGEDAAVELRRGATPVREFDFQPLDHVDLGEKLHLFDFEAGARVAGHGFYFLTGDGVLLELALQRYAVELLMREGFTVMTTPDLARDTILEGTGFMPRGPETQIYSITGSDLSLVATAEITLGGAFQERIFDATELPLALCGISHCFRTEAGAHGRATRGLYRVHQFTKVEMFAFTLPEQSEAMHERLLQLECRLFDGLGIPYRVIDTASGDLGGPAYRKFDLEAWMPGRGKAGEWGEVTSTSNCTDYQARRLGIRFKKAGEKGTTFVHTLNGTAVAISRAIIAILENHQQADGSVSVPAPLVPWMGKDVITT